MKKIQKSLFHLQVLQLTPLSLIENYLTLFFVQLL